MLLWDNHFSFFLMQQWIYKRRKQNKKKHSQLFYMICSCYKISPQHYCSGQAKYLMYISGCCCVHCVAHLVRIFGFLMACLFRGVGRLQKHGLSGVYTKQFYWNKRCCSKTLKISFNLWRMVVFMFINECIAWTTNSFCFLRCCFTFNVNLTYLNGAPKFFWRLSAASKLPEHDMFYAT